MRLASSRVSAPGDPVKTMFDHVACIERSLCVIEVASKRENGREVRGNKSFTNESET